MSTLHGKNFQTGVPVIDLTPARDGSRVDRERIARQIDEACCEIGFFTIAGHGVPEAIVRDLHEAWHAFFALPVGEKVRASHPVSSTPRGYHRLAGEALAGAMDEVAPPDLKEFFHVGPVHVIDDPYFTSARGREFFLPNIWPERSTRFRQIATA